MIRLLLMFFTKYPFVLYILMATFAVFSLVQGFNSGDTFLLAIGAAFTYMVIDINKKSKKNEAALKSLLDKIKSKKITAKYLEPYTRSAQVYIYEFNFDGKTFVFLYSPREEKGTPPVVPAEIMLDQNLVNNELKKTLVLKKEDRWRVDLMFRAEDF